MGAVCGKQYKIEDIYDRANLAYRKTQAAIEIEIWRDNYGQDGF